MANTTGKKFGGRQKGTPNKITLRVREMLAEVLRGEIERVPEYIEALQPKEKLEVIIKLLPYLVPKVEPIEVARLDLLETWDGIL